MALSIPIINDIIVEKIRQLEDKLDNDKRFYKTTILNLTTQINLLTEQNTDLLNSLENYNKTVEKNKQPSGQKKCFDKPPGLDEPVVLEKVVISDEPVVLEKNPRKSPDKWITVKRKNKKKRPNYKSKSQNYTVHHPRLSQLPSLM